MKNILITGGSRGIGFALVKKFIANNYHVITVSRSITALQNLDNITSLECDITNQTQLDHVIEIMRQFTLDGIINSAGYGMPAPLQLTSMEEINKHFQTNFFAPLKLIKETIQYNKCNKVIHMSSGAANNPLQSLFSYCTSKSAMHHAMRCFNLEYPETKFINIRPGIVKTDLYEKWSNMDDYVFPGGNYITTMAQTRGFTPVEKIADFIFEIWHLPNNECVTDIEIT